MCDLQVARACLKVAWPCLILMLYYCVIFNSGTAVLDFGTAVPDFNALFSLFLLKLRHISAHQSVPHTHYRKTH